MASQRNLSALLVVGGAIAWSGLSGAGLASPDTPIVPDHDMAAATVLAQAANTPNGYTVLHVNAESGSDRQGDGSQLRPYQTITHALRLAEANTLILLAGGVYSANTGETFPIALKPGVTLQGMAGPNVATVVISGNGAYYSESSGLRNIALLAANNAGLANVTVSNPHPEGTGLWIESGSPIVLDSAFSRNGLSGIHIAGSGTPVIRGNYFVENGQAGLVIAGPSSASVEANIFENTGVGITVAPEATPQIENNRISSNLDGLIIHADAQPTLRNNQISRNRRNSIVDYADWSTLPDLASRGATQPAPPNLATSNATPEESPIVTLAPTASVPALPAEVATFPAPPIPEPAATPALSDTTVDTVEPLESITVPEPAPVPATSVGTAADTVEPLEPVTVPEPLATTPAASASNLIPNLENASTSEAAIANPVPDQETIAANVPDTAHIEIPDAIALATTAPDLADDLVETTLAISAIDVPTVPLVSAHQALDTVDLNPLVTAFEAAARQIPEASAIADTNESDASTDESAIQAADTTASESRIASAPLPPLETPGLLETAPMGDDGQHEAIAIPVIPAPEEAVVKPSDRAETLTAHDLTSVIETTGNLPSLPPITRDPEPVSTTPLQVPGGDIPMGSGGDLPDLLAVPPATALNPAAPPAPPSLAASLGLNYRVLVEAADPSTQNQVRGYVTDAFRTRRDGQMYMQVGAYPTLAEAQAQVDRLHQIGLQAQIEDIP
jgi:parallel beta-helix repeat protein